jgi:FkbM family methyltransferase
MTLLQAAARKVSGGLGRQSWLIRRLRPAYESLLDVSTKGHGIPWKINGVTYRVDPRYRHHLGQTYDAPVAAFIRERLRPGATCLDVGANVGVYVLQFAHWSGEGGRVIAFEPNPSALEVLQKHIQLNDLSGRVEVVPAAVGADCGSATMFVAGAEGMSRLGAPNELIADQVKEITVPVLTLDKLCAERDLKPDWLFMDIEGFEIAALKGGRKMIGARGADLNIVVEMHPNVWSSADTTRSEAEALLDELDLLPVALTGQSDPLGEYGLVYLEHQESRE